MTASAPILPPKPPTIEEKILYAFPDAPIMLKVAIAESRLVPTAKNPESSATGLFQVLQGTWIGAGCKGDPKNADDNIACARKLYDDSGLVPWEASREHWSRI